jgi:hypothetical protein
LPIALPQLTGAHSGKRMAEVVLEICNGLGLAQTYSSTSWDSSCTGIYICSSAHLRQSIQRSSSPLSSSSCTVTRYCRSSISTRSNSVTLYSITLAITTALSSRSHSNQAGVSTLSNADSAAFLTRSTLSGSCYFGARTLTLSTATARRLILLRRRSL